MITDNIILLSTLVLYLVGFGFAHLFDKRIIMFLSVLWLVPIFIIEQPIIALFSVIMFLLHIIIPVLNATGGKDDFF